MLIAKDIRMVYEGVEVESEHGKKKTYDGGWEGVALRGKLR